MFRRDPTTHRRETTRIDRYGIGRTNLLRETNTNSRLVYRSKLPLSRPVFIRSFPPPVLSIGNETTVNETTEQYLLLYRSFDDFDTNRELQHLKHFVTTPRPKTTQQRNHNHGQQHPKQRIEEGQKEIESEQNKSRQRRAKTNDATGSVSWGREWTNNA